MLLYGRRWFTCHNYILQSELREGLASVYPSRLLVLSVRRTEALSYQLPTTERLRSIATLPQTCTELLADAA